MARNSPVGEREREVTAPAEGEKRKRSTRWPVKGEKLRSRHSRLKKITFTNF